jgi:hypothetical protein
MLRAVAMRILIQQGRCEIGGTDLNGALLGSLARQHVVSRVMMESGQ